jgi:hypothetical protein
VEVLRLQIEGEDVREQQVEGRADLGGGVTLQAALRAGPRGDVLWLVHGPAPEG